MRKLLGVLVICGALLLLGSVPCFADSGTGIGVSANATVIAGDPGGSGGWHSWGVTSSTTTLPPAVTEPDDEPEVPPPSEPVDNRPPPTTYPGYYDIYSDDTPAPTPAKSNNTIVIGIVVCGLLGALWLATKQQKRGG